MWHEYFESLFFQEWNKSFASNLWVNRELEAIDDVLYSFERDEELRLQAHQNAGQDHCPRDEKAAMRLDGHHDTINTGSS